jgi:hypothetical protein
MNAGGICCITEFSGFFSQNCEKQLLASSCLSVCLSVRPSAWKDSALSRGIFIQFNI